MQGEREVLLAYTCPALWNMSLGMKTEKKRMELSAAIFVFIFLCGSRNEYRNTGNKYKKRILPKTDMEQIRREQGRKADDYRNQKTT
jgi:hypothetical protein